MKLCLRIIPIFAQMFRQITAISLLFLFSINIAGYFPVFKLEQWHVRNEIKRRIKESIPVNQLHLITFSKKNKSEINWVREGKEFRYEGRMYDIVRSGSNAGTLHYYCIDDNQETHLFAHLHENVIKQMNTNSNSNQNPYRNILKVFSFFVFLPANQFDFSCIQNIWVKNQFAYFFLYPKIHFNKVYPPPQLVV